MNIKDVLQEHSNSTLILRYNENPQTSVYFRVVLTPEAISKIELLEVVRISGETKKVVQWPPPWSLEANEKAVIDWGYG